MASNETVEEIVKEMVEFGNHCAAFGGAYSPERWNNLCKRLIAAHMREITAHKDERLTIVANYETIITAKDGEIAALRERIKIAEMALEKIDNMCDGDMCKFFDTTHHCSACRYLAECQTGVAHAALYAIREKGANNATK